MSEHLVNGKYSIKDLVDIDKLRVIFERFSEVTGYTTGFLSYPELEILIATGWRDICTKFHRINPEGERICKDSNEKLLGRLKEVRELSIEKCGHGLVDGATPVIINGVYVACVATGQVFFEEPDIEWFRRHGERQGYDVEAYIEAVRSVPVVDEKSFKKTLTFLSEIAAMLSEVGFYAIEERENALKLKIEMKKREEAEVSLLEHQDHLETVVEERTADLTKKIKQLEDAMTHIKRLEGLVPICASCKKMLKEEQDPSDDKAWIPLEKYISDRSEAQFTHGLCPACIDKLYKESPHFKKKPKDSK